MREVLFCPGIYYVRKNSRILTLPITCAPYIPLPSQSLTPVSLPILLSTLGFISSSSIYLFSNFSLELHFYLHLCFLYLPVNVITFSTALQSRCPLAFKSREHNPNPKGKATHFMLKKFSDLCADDAIMAETVSASSMAVHFGLR